MLCVRQPRVFLDCDLRAGATLAWNKPAPWKYSGRVHFLPPIALPTDQRRRRQALPRPPLFGHISFGGGPLESGSGPLERVLFYAPEYVTISAATARTQLTSSTRRTGLPKRPPLASTAVSTTCFPSLCIEISCERANCPLSHKFLNLLDRSTLSVARAG